MRHALHIRANGLPRATEMMKPLRAAFDALLGWRAKRKAEAELMELDAHMLADIGISRDEIHHRVWG